MTGATPTAGPYALGGRGSIARRAALALVLGALSATALPPWFVLPAVFLHAVLAIVIVGSPTVRGAVLLGWCFAFGHHVVGLHWIANAMLVDGDRFAWAIPFAVAGLPAFFAVNYAVAAAILRWIRPGPVLLAPAFAVIWSLADLARGHLFTGFPWNLPGTVWAITDETMQPAAVLGLYGLSVLTLLLGALPAAVVSGGRRTQAGAVTAILLLPAVFFSHGAWRLSTAETAMVEGVVVRVVQGNVPQVEKWDHGLRVGHLTRYANLTRRAKADLRSPGLSPDSPVTAVVWPETAVAFFLAREPALMEALGRLVPESGSLLVGAPVDERADDGGRRVFNSLLALGQGSSGGAPGITARYDKSHLVPFGEYMPLRAWLPIDKVVAGFNDFSAGEGLVTLEVPGLPPFSPLICYEVIFPGDVAPEGGSSPQLLLNLTNDAWFGDSAGPVQHLVSARFRSVEEGLPLVRAANTGISASVDSYGKVLVEIETDKTGTFDTQISLPVSPRPIYVQFRGLPFVFFVAVVFILLGFEQIRRLQTDRRTGTTEIG